MENIAAELTLDTPAKEHKATSCEVCTGIISDAKKIWPTNCTTINAQQFADVLTKYQQAFESATKTQSWRLEVHHLYIVFVMATTGMFRQPTNDSKTNDLTFDEFARVMCWLGPIKEHAVSRKSIKTCFMEHFTGATPENDSKTLLAWKPAQSWGGLCDANTVEKHLTTKLPGVVWFGPLCTAAARHHSGQVVLSAIQKIIQDVTIIRRTNIYDVDNHE